MVQEGGARAVYGSLSRLFSLGTWTATVLIAIGCGFQLVWSRVSIGSDLCWIGVAIFVLLPLTGLLTISALHFRQGKYAFGSIAAAILFVILGAALLNMTDHSSISACNYSDRPLATQVLPFLRGGANVRI